ncbi:hypothetical protein PMI01_02542 [Caulobacter sp. AP07]|uniref:hypothetical protein n=1 Tax=Caulobacter sp. AP07 TaxID=1144304 RepID=UPI000271FC82|nr:hypothetical protein [Caulobacter sp. AP07]EJL32551.1 hypothetical protein PMI01_02542 [Caulobacter sp. AP07]
MLAAVFLLCALAPASLGQVEASSAAEVGAPQAQPPASSATAGPRLAAGTQIEVELVDALSSGASKLGDKFKIRLASAISSQGADVFAAGSLGEGEVIDVARAGMGGKQGKLIISARYLDLNGRRVRVRGMTFMASGKSRVDLATGVLLVPYAGVAAVLIKGGEIEIPAGARATVRLAEDLELPVNPVMESTGKF